MKKMFMAVIAMMMTISASAQFYIYCSDGNVIKVDSISMIAPEESEQPNPSAGIGVFSVSANKQVTFSKGNLQYHPANDEWRFADNQTDYIGEANSNISFTYNGWLDMFGWGTGDNPTNYSEYDGDYQTFVDWGTNKIGCDTPNTWRTLTYDEWYYILFVRENADGLCGIACVDSVNGLILLPDDWTGVDGLSFISGFHSDNSIEAYAMYQTLTADQWSKLETSGAVFLPATGRRDGVYLYYMHHYGDYWSASEYDFSYAYFLSFSSFYMDMHIDIPRSSGRSVRLVKDL